MEIQPPRLQRKYKYFYHTALSFYDFFYKKVFDQLVELVIKI